MNRLMQSFPLAAVLVTLSAAATPVAQQTGQMMDTMPAARPMGDTMAMTNDFKPFTAEAFKAAKAGGQPTLVFFHAPWCPVCRSQEPKLRALLNGEYTHVIPLMVDYDSNAALRKEMSVQKQSTVILFQGEKELARISYTSDDEAIRGLFAHAKPMGMAK